jgi:hypothetical protein
MTLVLTPFRLFTKAVQYRDKVTTAYLPHLLDDLVGQLTPGAFSQRLIGRAAGVLEQVEAFQLHLIAGIRERFADLFAEGSLALAATYLLPGSEPLTFTNSPSVPVELKYGTRESLSEKSVELAFFCCCIQSNIVF